MIVYTYTYINIALYISTPTIFGYWKEFILQKNIKMYFNEIKNYAEKISLLK